MADTVLDTSGLECPLPVLKAKKALKGLKPGDVLQIIATDPGSVADFEVLCAVQGHRLLSHSETAGVFRFRIELGRAA
jgi:tRNA 2-thiouridine synthesizing protein A